jgi:membrane protease YdiL (CAAX protease family)
VLLTVGLFDKFSRALGEEIGWRGLLVPELLKVTTFRRTAIISGLIWGAWHIPAMLYADYGAAGTPMGFQLVCFVANIIAFSFIYAWLRLRSGSVWPAAILHAAHNLIVQSILDQATVDRGAAAWLTTEFGLGLVLAGLVLAWAMTRPRLGRQEPEPAVGR